MVYHRTASERDREDGQWQCVWCRDGGHAIGAKWGFSPEDKLLDAWKDMIKKANTLQGPVNQFHHTDSQSWMKIVHHVYHGDLYSHSHVKHQSLKVSIPTMCRFPIMRQTQLQSIMSESCRQWTPCARNSSETKKITPGDMREYRMNKLNRQGKETERSIQMNRVKGCYDLFLFLI